MRRDRRTAGLGIDWKLAVGLAVIAWIAHSLLLLFIGAFAYEWLFYWAWAAAALVIAALLALRGMRQPVLLLGIVAGVLSSVGRMAMMASGRWASSAGLVVIPSALAVAASAFALYRVRSARSPPDRSTPAE